MTYIFEDYRDDPIQKLFRSAFEKAVPNQFVYANGNNKIRGELSKLYKLGETEVYIYFDIPVENVRCIEEYNLMVREWSRKFDKFMVIPIPCMEYFFIKSIYNLGIIANADVDILNLENCINMKFYDEILSSRASDEDITYCKNFERACKLIIRKLRIECLSKRNADACEEIGEYYVRDCLCENHLDSCGHLSLLNKALEMARCMPCVPKGSQFENKRELTWDEVRSVHRELVSELNSRIVKYAERKKSNETVIIKKLLML